jgi:hypothetical protein
LLNGNGRFLGGLSRVSHVGVLRGGGGGDRLGLGRQCALRLNRAINNMIEAKHPTQALEKLAAFFVAKRGGGQVSLPLGQGGTEIGELLC